MSYKTWGLKKTFWLWYYGIDLAFKRYQPFCFLWLYIRRQRFSLCDLSQLSVDMSVLLPGGPSVFLSSSVCSSFYLFFFLSDGPVCLLQPVLLSVSSYLCLFFFLFVLLSVFSSLFLFFFLSVLLFVCSSICLSFCLSLFLSYLLSVCLSNSYNKLLH